ncbi:Transcription-repair coupling factor [hydrothermal vent metagenome]|uniref:Transcription-repair coupling factor n=1 Tax=hydrothermal vent metagenome TaxID=652676 RepID=A0A3B1BJC7_9ZZZZ
MISIYGLEKVLANAEQGKGPVSANGLTISVKGLLTASLARRIGRPLVVVCDKAAQAEEFYETLRFFMPPVEEDEDTLPLFYFPPWEILPYENLSPYPQISGQRLLALTQVLESKKNFILVTAVEAIARKTIPRDVLSKSRLKIERDDKMDIEPLSDHLVEHGYRRVGLAEERGEFSVRGNIVDIYDGAGAYPVRVEFDGDTVESIRLFNPYNQRSKKAVGSYTFLPFREVFYEGVSLETLSSGYTRLLENLGVSEGTGGRIAELLKSRVFFSGIEKFLPLFYGETHSLFDYLPGSAALILDEPDNLNSHREKFYSLIKDKYSETTLSQEPVPEPDQLFLAEGELTEIIDKKTLLNLCELAVSEEDESSFVISTSAPRRYKGDIGSFIDDARKKVEDGFSIVMATATEKGAEKLDKTLKDNELGARRLEPDEWASLLDQLSKSQPSLFEGNLFITVGKVAEGFVIGPDKWMLITEDEIFGKIRQVQRRGKSRPRTFGASLSQLKNGDIVVHRAHGIGRYIGAKEMIIADNTDEYLEIEYAERQRLYVPLHSIEFVRKFTGGGADSEPPLDRMGGVTWRKTVGKVKKSLLEMADKLLKVYAARKLDKGWAFSPETAFHNEFADTFEFDETEDQAGAINDILADMEKSRPMDRLVCGDVGYGKTEVAMRAAFKAAYDGRQVAVLVPTTLLAQQHYQTFSERFKAFPVNVDVLSRFKTRKEQKKIVEMASSGEVDILIGTHRLLQKDISFKNLGLVIIDEEQRFGVKHKEKLRSMRHSVDVLTLTATPIPRTLHTSMLGIRDLSIIETPPPERQSIRTFIMKFSDKTIREALLRELDRGGQAFFVHNKVKSIHSIASYISKLVPEARVAIAHGQMPERELEDVMLDFVDRKYDVLVCTTIIESGLDITSANTIIVNRADHFGLAQLYQLRGRVGRDRHRAYGYMLVPGVAALTSQARKRLKAIEELSELGSGLRLALKDMEIRGAGNLLGSQQSGQINAVGFDTYCEMLENTIRELKGEKVEEKVEVAMNLSFKGRIAPEYVPDLTQRIDLYNRVGSVTSSDQIVDIKEEMIDRFGSLPEETEKLLTVAMIKALAVELKIEKVDVTGSRLYLVFSPATGLAPEKLADSALKSDDRFKFVSDSAIEITMNGKGWREKSAGMVRFLEKLVETL